MKEQEGGCLGRGRGGRGWDRRGVTHTEPSPAAGAWGAALSPHPPEPSRPTGPASNQPSITHCLLLLTAHLLALVKHVVNK